MDIQYVIAGVLIVGGALMAWIGPDVGWEQPDGTDGPALPEDRWKIRAFGVVCVACGLFVLVATLLGFRAPPNDGPGAP